jgi:pimeloyl-ACP methyl ester carboxylesterase
VRVADHAADAAALLDHLGLRRAHVAGHSSGAAVGLQLALDRPEIVHTLSVLEPSILSLSCAKAFVQSASPVFEVYAAGDHEAALEAFMSAVSGLDWKTCKALLDERVPGAVAQAIKDADTFFGIELPALTQWIFGAEQAAAINQPVLSVLGHPSHVGGHRRLASLLAPARRGLYDPGRWPPAAHPASGAGRPRHRGIFGSPPHGDRLAIPSRLSLV